MHWPKGTRNCPLSTGQCLHSHLIWKMWCTLCAQGTPKSEPNSATKIIFLDGTKAYGQKGAGLRGSKSFASTIRPGSWQKIQFVNFHLIVALCWSSVDLVDGCGMWHGGGYIRWGGRVQGAGHKWLQLLATSQGNRYSDTQRSLERKFDIN